MLQIRLNLSAILLASAVFLALTFQAFAFGKWTDWEAFTSRNGVDIYYRVYRPTQRGWALLCQWRAVNNNSEPMWVGFGRKEYHLDNGQTAYGTSEGSDVRANGKYTFVEDTVIQNGYGIEIGSVRLETLTVRPSR